MHFRRQFRAVFPTLQDSINGGYLSLCLLILVLVIYRHFLQEKYDPNKCNALLAKGRWLDHAYQNWQPPGCMMHSYKANDISTCLRSRRLVFVGDSLTRQIFWATAKKLDIVEQPKEQHTSIALESKGVTIEFFWDPYLNSSNLQAELSATSIRPSHDDPADSPAIMLMGGGLWDARYMGNDYLEHYIHTIEDISKSKALNDAGSSTSWNSDSGRPGNSEESLVLLAPVSTPLYDSLSPARAHSLTSSRIDPMNMYLQQLSHNSNVPIAWSFAFMTARDDTSHQSDGLHIVESAASRMADLLLNIRCNSVLRRGGAKSYPTDKTCCNTYEHPNWTQQLFLKGAVGLLPPIHLAASRKSPRIAYLPSRKTVQAITVLALTSCYCYFADRTQLFDKMQKQYNSTEFILMCIVTAVLGIISIRRSAAATAQKTPHISAPQMPDRSFLSREQTDEWKGWMQITILIYHYTGASRVLWIYKIIRLLVASYLFMSGYGHTMFFYKKRDYSLRRLASVLIRINMLSCILPYVMKTDYLFYYFAPLISYWYIVIYVTMAVANCKNKFTAFLVVKILLSAAFTIAFTKTPGVLELIFSVLGKCCGIHWDVKEWRFRVQLDAYIVYVGMLFAIASTRVLKALGTRSDIENLLQDSIWQMSNRYLRRILLVLAIFLVVVFYLLTGQAPDKASYNSWLPFISALPIFAFIELRNINYRTRNSYSSTFAWMGQHSLETFTLQYHIWLAADTKGLLALGVFDRLVGAEHGRRIEFVILTIIFLWVCWHVASATQTLTDWIIDPSEENGDIVAYASKGAEGNLPSTKISHDVKLEQSPAHTVEGVGAKAVRCAGKFKRLVAGDLRFRLATMLGALWLLNVTYS